MRKKLTTHFSETIKLTTFKFNGVGLNTYNTEDELVALEIKAKAANLEFDGIKLNIEQVENGFKVSIDAKGEFVELQIKSEMVHLEFNGINLNIDRVENGFFIVSKLN